MRKQKTIQVDGGRIRIDARSRTYVGNASGFNVSVNGTERFVNCLSIDEAMDKALTHYLGTERSRAVKRNQIKVGHEYLCKIGRNDVKVVAVSVPAIGSIILKTVVSGKTVKIADPVRLKAVPGGNATTRDDGAHVAAPVAETPTTTTAPTPRHTRKHGASQPQEKRLGLMGAAMKVLQEAGQADLPMSCKKMVETAMAKGYWSPLNGGKTPVNTLAAMILRDLKENGNDAKLRRAEERFGRGRFFLNR